jgi:hypothetical protein
MNDLVKVRELEAKERAEQVRITNIFCRHMKKAELLQELGNLTYEYIKTREALMQLKDWEKIAGKIDAFRADELSKLVRAFY